MTRRAVALAALLLLVGAQQAFLAGAQKTAQSDWTIPATASQQLNPIAVSPDVLAKGQKIFESRCQRCHGRDARGHGPDTDPAHPAGNFTDRLRAAFNPDGVMFYKIWNGREGPKMPSFRKEGLTKEEVWTVIHFVKTFRK